MSHGDSIKRVLCVIKPCFRVYALVRHLNNNRICMMDDTLPHSRIACIVPHSAFRLMDVNSFNLLMPSSTLSEYANSCTEQLRILTFVEVFYAHAN